MESATPYKQHHHSLRRKRCRRLCLICAAILLAVFVILLILGLTVFRVHHAVSTVNAVRLVNLRAGINIPNVSVDLNVTLALDITATNPNHASFRFGAGTAELYYRGILAGEAAIPPGNVAAEGAVQMNVVLTILAGRLIGDAAVYADVIAGSLGLTTVTTIPGRVTVLGVIKRHMVIYTTCDVTVNLRNRSVDNSDCSAMGKFYNVNGGEAMKPEWKVINGPYQDNTWSCYFYVMKAMLDIVTMCITSSWGLLFNDRDKTPYSYEDFLELRKLWAKNFLIRMEENKATPSRRRARKQK